MDFKSYAETDLEKWKELINCKVEHEYYGVGTVEDITKSNKDKELIIIHINFNGKVIKLNNKGFCKYFYVITDGSYEKLLRKFEGLTKPNTGFVKGITHCWSCKEVIFNTNTKCPKCRWYRCNFCGSCRCNY